MDRTLRESLAYLISRGTQLPPDQVNATLREIWPRLHGLLQRWA